MDILFYLNLFLTFLDKHTWLITIGTALVTVGFAIWQINRQFKNTLDSQKENKLNELHMQIYKEIAEKIELCQAALTKSSNAADSLLSSFNMKIRLDGSARSRGLSHSNFIIPERHSEMRSIHDNAMQKLVEVLCVMDKYEIAFTDFSNMKMHIQLSLTELVNATSDFHHFISEYLPMDVKEGDRPNFGTNILIPDLPEQEALVKMAELSEAVTGFSLDLTSYLHDLRIESQNVLLSPIFNNKQAPKRIPGDPNFKVLTVNNYK